jgi:hypothetical protein
VLERRRRRRSSRRHRFCICGASTHNLLLKYMEVLVFSFLIIFIKIDIAKCFLCCQRKTECGYGEAEGKKSGLQFAIAATLQIVVKRYTRLYDIRMRFSDAVEMKEGEEFHRIRVIYM